MKCLGFPGKLCQEKLLVERAGNAPTHPWIHLPLQQLGQPRTRSTGEQQCHWGVPSGIAGMFGMPLFQEMGRAGGRTTTQQEWCCSSQGSRSSSPARGVCQEGTKVTFGLHESLGRDSQGILKYFPRFYWGTSQGFTEFSWTLSGNPQQLFLPWQE